MTRYFITFEGGEGSGKTTQVNRLADHLRADGQTVLTTREPGGSPGADAIRHVVLSGAAAELGAEMEAILFAAARADHVETLIRPTLRRSEIVLCDRFHDSTRAYQFMEEGVDDRLRRRLETSAMRGIYPDFTVVLDVPAEIGLERARQRAGPTGRDRFEAEDVSLHEKRRHAFLSIAEADSRRCLVVDGTGAPDEIARTIAAAVDDRLNAARFETIGENLRTPPPTP